MTAQLQTPSQIDSELEKKLTEDVYRITIEYLKLIEKPFNNLQELKKSEEELLSLIKSGRVTPESVASLYADIQNTKNDYEKEISEKSLEFFRKMILSNPGLVEYVMNGGKIGLPPEQYETVKTSLEYMLTKVDPERAFLFGERKIDFIEYNPMAVSCALGTIRKNIETLMGSLSEDVKKVVKDVIITYDNFAKKASSEIAKKVGLDENKVYELFWGGLATVGVSTALVALPYVIEKIGEFLTSKDGLELLGYFGLAGTAVFAAALAKVYNSCDKELRKASAELYSEFKQKLLSALYMKSQGRYEQSAAPTIQYQRPPENPGTAGISGMSKSPQISYQNPVVDKIIEGFVNGIVDSLFGGDEKEQKNKKPVMVVA